MNPAVFGSLPSSACTLGTQGSFGPDRISETIYDAAGQLRQTVHGLGTPVQQVYETFKYSLNGKQIAVADADEVSTIGVANADALNANAIAAHQTNFVYDGFDRLVETLYADGTGAQITSYDNDNNPLTHMTRAGQTITSTYDVLDRVATKAVPATAVPEGALCRDSARARVLVVCCRSGTRIATVWTPLALSKAASRPCPRAS